MLNKSFDESVPFFPIPGTNPIIKLPILSIVLFRENGSEVSLPLLFDTGASVTTLRKDQYPLLGLSSWDEGTPVEITTAGGEETVTVYEYSATVKLFEKTIATKVQLAELPQNPFFMGLLGRQDVMSQFGFGFWESSEELLVAHNP